MAAHRKAQAKQSTVRCQADDRPQPRCSRGPVRPRETRVLSGLTAPPSTALRLDNLPDLEDISGGSHVEMTPPRQQHVTCRLRPSGASSGGPSHPSGEPPSQNSSDERRTVQARPWGVRDRRHGQANARIARRFLRALSREGRIPAGLWVRSRIHHARNRCPHRPGHCEAVHEPLRWIDP